MITAGVPLMQALAMAGQNRALGASGKNIAAILQHLRNGLSFSDAMVKVHGWLPDFDIALLTAGEQTGRIDVSFKTLGEYYGTRVMIIRETLTSLILPALNFHVFLLIFPLPLLVAMVIGIINNDYAMCFPFIREKVEAYGLLWTIIFLVIFACQGKLGERWRAFLEFVHQLIPMLRTALKYLALFRLTTALVSLVDAGVSIIKSWPMSAAASGSPHLKKQIAEWPAQLEAGLTPSELVANEHYFPEMFRNLYHTGEISGHLDDTLQRLQTYYRDEGFRILRMFMRILSGGIYALIALRIAFFVIGFYLHYFNSLVNGF